VTLKTIIHQLVYIHTVIAHDQHGELMIVGRRRPWRWLLGTSLRVFERPPDAPHWTEISVEELSRYVD